MGRMHARGKTRREGGIISFHPREERPLQANMVFHVIPWGPIPGELAMGFSETVRVTEEACEVLTNLPWPEGHAGERQPAVRDRPAAPAPAAAGGADVSQGIPRKAVPKGGESLKVAPEAKRRRNGAGEGPNGTGR